MTDLREQEMQSQIDALSSTAENWKNTAKNLKTENQMLKAQVAQLQKMVYGSRTEKTKRILPETADGQLNQGFPPGPALRRIPLQQNDPASML